MEGLLLPKQEEVTLLRCFEEISVFEEAESWLHKGFTALAGTYLKDTCSQNFAIGALISCALVGLSRNLPAIHLLYTCVFQHLQAIIVTFKIISLEINKMCYINYFNKLSIQLCYYAYKIFFLCLLFFQYKYLEISQFLIFIQNFHTERGGGEEAGDLLGWVEMGVWERMGLVSYRDRIPR